MSAPNDSVRLNASAPRISRSGLRIGNVTGVPVEISWVTFFVLLLVGANVYGATYSHRFDSRLSFIVAAIFVIGYAVSIFVHELGHTVAAHAFRIEVSRIRLVAWGGLAELERAPSTALSAFVVAIAGPVGSALCGIVAWILARKVLGSDSAYGLMFGYLALLNGAMTVLNLLPGNPLDGGRVFSAAVWAATGNRHDGEAAVRVSGMMTAAAVGLASVLAANGVVRVPFEPIFGILIAAVLFSAARASGSDRPSPLEGSGLMARDLGRPVVALVPIDVPLDQVMSHLPHTGTIGVVNADGLLLGIAELERIARVASATKSGPTANLGELSQPIAHYAVASPNEDAEIVDARRRASVSKMCLVMSAGKPALIIDAASTKAVVSSFGHRRALLRDQAQI